MSEKDLHVLVTGGAGFIGSHSVDALLADGARVTVLDDFSSGKMSNLPERASGLRVVQGDIRDTPLVDELMGTGVNAVLHLAAQVSVEASVQKPTDSCSRNISGFLNVLDGARRAGVKRFVYASSAAVYGDPEQLPLDETSRVSALSPYGLEKSVNDQYAALFAHLYGIQPLGMRYFNVYGPRQDPSSHYAGVISIFAERIRAGRGATIFGDGEQTRDFIYVTDVARANRAALRGTLAGVCNVATGTTVTLNQLVDALGHAAGRSLPIEHGEPRAGDIRHSASRNERLMTLLGADVEFVQLEAGLTALLKSMGIGTAG